MDIESCLKEKGSIEIHDSGVQSSSSSADPFQEPLPAPILQQAHHFITRYGQSAISLETLSSLGVIEIYQLALDSFSSHCHAFHIAVEQASSEYMDLTAKIRNSAQPYFDNPGPFPDISPFSTFQDDIVSNVPRLGMLSSSHPH